MHPPLNVPPTSWEKTLLKWAVIILVAFLAGTTALQQYDAYRLAHAERWLASAACATRPDPDACRMQVAEHHTRCFNPNSHMGRDRFWQGYFDRAQYVRCLEMGYDTWLTARDRKEIEEFKKRKAGLE